MLWSYRRLFFRNGRIVHGIRTHYRIRFCHWAMQCNPRASRSRNQPSLYCANCKVRAQCSRNDRIPPGNVPRTYACCMHGTSAHNSACMHYGFWQSLACTRYVCDIVCVHEPACVLASRERSRGGRQRRPPFGDTRYCIRGARRLLVEALIVG